MSQEDIFQRGEADQWFIRNKEALAQPDRPDWPLRIIADMPQAQSFTQVLELGCSNGWRLARLRESLGEQNRYVGVDPGSGALAHGRSAFPGLELHIGNLSDVPLQETFDLVIVNFVLHWVDRNLLSKSLAEIDRLVADGGYLLIGDFLPDSPAKRPYHHLQNERVFTFKQDYPRVFTAMGIYSEVVRITHSHGAKDKALVPVASDERAACSLLYKSLEGYYSESKP